MIEEGKTPPPLRLPDQDGRSFDLEELRGRHVVVFFYPRDETPGCTAEACAFRDLWDRFKEHQVAVVGVSPDGSESHQAFIANHDLPFTLLSDPDKSAMTAWGAWGEKTMYGRTSTGTIRSTVWIGPDGSVRKHWQRVGRAGDHPQHVLATITAAGGA